ncbi:MAG: hypothetical protein ACK559_07605, partial [bacterium]
MEGVGLVRVGHALELSGRHGAPDAAAARAGERVVACVGEQPVRQPAAERHAALRPAHEIGVVVEPRGEERVHELGWLAQRAQARGARVCAE